MPELIYSGAEAKIFLLKKGIIKKERIAKKYRNSELDVFLRKKRTSAEEKNLVFARRYGLNVPSVLDRKNFSLFLEYIDAPKLQKIIKKDNYSEICSLLGKEIKKMHDFGLIHGDLTTSNILYKNKKLFFIDFGLSFKSNRIEDKAVDLLNLKKTFESTHPSLKNAWQIILDSYNDSQVSAKISEIEKRARYN